MDTRSPDDVLDEHALSPELVLVDPTLRALALARLPSRPWERAAAPDAPASEIPAEDVVADERALDPAASPSGRKASRRWLPLVLGAVAAACLMLVVLEMQTLVQRGSRHAAAADPPGRLLAWAPVRRAGQYRILVVAGDRVVVDTVTRVPRLRVDLPDGSYQWWVWPVLPSGGRAPAVVQATLEIPIPQP